MLYQLLNILRRFVKGKAGKWLTTIAILMPLIFFGSRYLGLPTNISIFLMIGAVVLVLLMWLVGNLRTLQNRKKSQEFENDLGRHNRSAAASKEEIQQAVDDLSEQWGTAMRELKEHRVSIYDLPWFLLIGEPQSGKTTTLEKSGLEFPIGQEAISGAGGTRNCDWWFTEEAVILDTAGRFAFPEDAAPDKHEWDAFLKLLRKHRRECPINGVLVVIPATSLTEDTLDQQREKAKNIRRKLENLQKSMEIRFPIFVLITKADRILGFSEFFGSLAPDLHGQIFGWSNEDEDKRWDPANLSGILAELTGRMHKLRLRLMQDAADVHQIDRFLVFPEELAALEVPLRTYLETIFKAASRFQEPFIFRGFYLTSGLQEGRPIAMACRDLLRVQVGDARQVLEELETVLTHKFAFFIRDLYSKKVFPEQGLVKRTIAAAQKEKRYRRTTRYMLIGAAALAFLTLLPSITHLYQVLRPVNKLAADAKLCLEIAQTEEPCGVFETYELIYDIEQARENLGDSRWILRFLLQRGIKNEIGQELLPTLQAGLFRLGVLQPLLESFEARSGPEIWRDEAMEYDLFREAFAARLRFDHYQWAESEKPALREVATLDPLLRYLQQLPDRDDTLDGREIDLWLEDTSALGEIDEIERVFQSVLTTEEKFDMMAVGKLQSPERARAAFDTYWSIALLAKWDYQLIEDYFRVYEASYRDILDLDPEGAGGEETLLRFAELSSDLGRAFTNGAAFMAERGGRGAGEAEMEGEEDGEAVAAEDDDAPDEPRRRRRRSRREAPAREVAEVLDHSRPGRDSEAWQKNCYTDYERLRQIHSRIVPKDHPQNHCRVRIPEDWKQLIADRSAFEYLYEESADGALQWSEGAERLQAPLVALGSRIGPQRVAEDRTGFRERVEGALGDTDAIREIGDFFDQQRQALWEPVGQLATFAGGSPDDRFEAQRGRQQGELLAALGAGMMILPPADDFLREKFRLDCSSCFTKSYAESFVRPANKFLGQSNAALRPASAVSEVRQHLDGINTALYRYLETFIDRLDSGGGGGGGFQRPYGASNAATWSRFAAAIRDWRIDAPAAAAPRQSGSGLTQQLVQEFANSNSRLQPLVDRFLSVTRPRAAAPVRIPADLERAVASYKSVFEVLEDEPLAAWRQLALGEDGASLDGFHSFSRSSRLRRNSQGKWLAANVEEHGARLLSDAIRPRFQQEAERLWGYLDNCCRRRFPFITERELLKQRRSYDQGHAAAGRGAEPWLGLERRTDISTLRVELPTVSRDEIDRLFYAGGDCDRLFRDFALQPLLGDPESEPVTTVDFVSPYRKRLRTLSQWQSFLYGDAGDGRGRQRNLADDQTFELRILEDRKTADRLYLGERMGRISLFSRDKIIRPSTDARTGRRLSIPLRYDEAPLSVTGTNEDEGTGWNGRLEISGGPLKLIYFVLLAREESRADGQVWVVRVEVPDFGQPRNRLEGLFELTFNRPVPGVVFDDPPRSGGEALSARDPASRESRSGRRP
ncbi:MAG: type VI secretion protein IcmF/TssM N-terminal domain-containing protein [Acidobacteriota bacterium]